MDGSIPALDTVTPPVRKTLLRGCAIATALAAIIATQVYLSMMSHGHSYLRLFTWQWGNWAFWALVSHLVMSVGGRLTIDRAFRRRLAGALILGPALILAHAALTAVLTSTIQPFAPVVAPRGVIDTFRGQSPSLFVMDTLIYSMLLIGGSAYYSHQRARQHVLRESRLEAQLARAQLEALRLEIQPHFLFNTLNSIAALIRLREHDGALKMLLGLSDMMRSTIERPKNQLVTLSAEIEFVKRYVDLQHARFADRLQVQYDIEDRCNDVDVPTFLLQPLVENALRHGAGPRTTTCHIQIGACAESGRLRLWVKDDGVGLPHGFDLARDAGTGLSNTRSRLAQLYGAAASFDVRGGDAAGTIVEIGLPFSPPFATAAATT